MYEDVLLAVDGSESNEPAVERALDLAAATGATLHVVHVVDRTTAVTAAAEGAERVLAALEAAGRDVVDAAVARAEQRDLSVEASVLSGAPHRAILDYAADREVDVIVVGTHGRTGVERVVLGSVAERVVRRADVPVLVVPATVADDD
ncbi:MAG: universal stress protein [Haloarculaceae archaeon]